MALVALPVETKTREINGKVLLSLHLAQKGHQVIIGEMGTVNKGCHILDPDIYIGDGGAYRKGRETLYQHLTKAGKRIGTLDTEGGLFATEEAFRLRSNPQVLKYTDFYLAWGEIPKRLVSERNPNLRQSIMSVGNPGFDFAHPNYKEFFKEEIEQIRERYGKFILVNTNFSGVNYFDQEIRNKSALRNKPERWSYLKNLFDLFIEMLVDLPNIFGNISIVIRPHPSENHDFYRKLFKNHSNVHVVHEFSVYPWIHASCLVIHNSCTTGMEAAIAQKPVFSYRPIRSDEFDLELPNFVSMQFEKKKNLYSEVKKWIERSQPYIMDGKQVAKINEYARNLDGNSALRCANFIDEYLESEPFKNGRKKKFFKYFRARVIFMFESIIFSILDTLLPKRRVGAMYRKQKFPYLNNKEMDSIIFRLKEICNIRESFKVNQLHGLNNCFVVRLAENASFQNKSSNDE